MAIYISDKQDEEKAPASESGHWYDWEGNPRYTLVGANGKERNTTLRDARKLGLLPSVTTIIRTLASPGLDRWKQEQVLMAALTLTRAPGETDEAFIARIIEDSTTATRAASDRGTALHGAIERWLLSGGTEHQGPWQSHVEHTYDACKAVGIDLLAGKPERSFAHHYGYAGKIDWSSDEAVIDFKTKAMLPPKLKPYDEHVMQLAAYDMGLGNSGRRMLNVFIGADDCNVSVFEWDDEDRTRGFAMFSAALSLWKNKNRYFPEPSRA